MEHNTTRTFSDLHNALGYIYKYPNLTVYHTLVIVLGTPVALALGILNG